ncbi:hypothetical protein [Caproiciproducens faecalis]|uniref:Lipoprotein n=1 Tax=Caproiciproducens faecalis TaxID=2820301 RepID=A0ABS7DJ90_9FIRM|nr:hypothetical protein [Caproiciproducens faecalis]MBW7571360.1 hypothetical protein [Caproiciproducens faecalis]
MKNKIKCKKILSILLVFILVLLTACSSKSSQQSSEAESSKSGSESEEVPSDLTELENNIEMIEQTLDGPSIQTKPMQQAGQSTQSGEGAQSGDDAQSGGGAQSGQSDQSQPGSQSSQQGQGQQQSQPSSSSQQDPIEKIPAIVDKMHYQWNNLMPVAIKKGANNDLVNNFGNRLNDLSSTVVSKNKMKTLIAANQLYVYIPDLYLLFKSKLSPEIKRVRYYSRSAILNASSANWTQADSDMSSLKSVWAVYRNSLSKDQQDNATKLDLSINELEKVIKERKQPLIAIKGKVEFSNIQALEKATQKESGGQSGGQQSSEEQSGS